MIAKRIKGCNVNMGKPKDWDEEKQGKCHALAVRVLQIPEGDFVCESSWEPTQNELEMLNAGGTVILRIYGQQPPVMLYTEINHD